MACQECIRLGELEELKKLQKWFHLMSSFDGDHWKSSPDNIEKINRLAELRSKYFLDPLAD